MVPKNRSKFQPYSIIKTCEIQGDADLVAGFYVCDNLIIDGRDPDAPLYMIGTFIAKHIDIDPSALKAGITMMSIYHPDALEILRNSRILKVANQIDNPNFPNCNDQLTGRPVWDHDSPKTPDRQDLTSCNVLYLRNMAQPFQWTAVDPDCGTLPNQSNTVCKQHPVNYFVIEHARGGGP